MITHILVNNMVILNAPLFSFNDDWILVMSLSAKKRLHCFCTIVIAPPLSKSINFCSNACISVKSEPVLVIILFNSGMAFSGKG